MDDVADVVKDVKRPLLGVVPRAPGIAAGHGLALANAAEVTRRVVRFVPSVELVDGDGLLFGNDPPERAGYIPAHAALLFQKTRHRVQDAALGTARDHQFVVETFENDHLAKRGLQRQVEALHVIGQTHVNGRPPRRFRCGSAVLYDREARACDLLYVILHPPGRQRDVGVVPVTLLPVLRILRLVVRSRVPLLIGLRRPGRRLPPGPHDGRLRLTVLNQVERLRPTQVAGEEQRAAEAPR